MKSSVLRKLQAYNPATKGFCLVLGDTYFKESFLVAASDHKICKTEYRGQCKRKATINKINSLYLQ